MTATATDPITPAVELRAAADKLRALATAAAHEDRTRWEVGHTLGSKSRVVVDDHKRPTVLIETWAQHREQVDDYLAAFASPAVGTTVADLLTAAADLADAYPEMAHDHDRPACEDYACDLMGRAIETARAILVDAATLRPYTPESRA